MEYQTLDSNSENEFDTTNELTLYSKKVIRAFSIFFSSIFGTVLLMQNLLAIGKKKAAYLVLACGGVYSLLSIVIINMADKPITVLTYVFNIVGGLVLSELVFDWLIPKGTIFKDKKPLKAFLISLAIIIPLIVAMIYTI